MARDISLTRAAAILGTLLGALLDAGCKESLAPTPITVTGVSPAIGAGFLHTCGLASTGAASCWGDNSKGQVGSDPIGSLILIPVAVSGGRTFSALAAGWTHNCGLTSAGAAYCWGYNAYGQLGNGSTTNTLTPVAVSGGLSFSAIATGGGHTCGLTNAGAAYCWGYNAYGELGNGSTTNSLTPVAASGGLSFSSITTGDGHTCGITAAGAAYCWGYNGYGQLGNSLGGDSSVPVAVFRWP